MSRKKIMISDTYIPGVSTRFQLSVIEHQSEQDNIEIHSFENSFQSELVKIGLSNACKKNMKYNELIRESGIGYKSSQDIIKEYLASISVNLKRTSTRRNNQFKYAKSIEAISDEKKDFVVQWFKHNWSLK